MDKILIATRTWIGATLLAVCLPAAAIHAQGGQSAPLAPPQVAQVAADEELLARAGKLYYSSAREGITGFECNVDPDWHALFISANKGKTITEDDARLVLLKTVKITLQARLKGGSTVEWVQAPDPDKPLDADSNKLLDDMQKAAEQTLQGFMQFWTPFVDGSVVPASTKGIDITHTATTHTIHAVDSGAEVTEIFDDNLLLHEFNVSMKGTSIELVPAYESTQKGLLVNRLVAHIQPAGSKPEQAQEMRVAIVYQTLDGVPIPARLNMEVRGLGIFNFALNGCRVNR